MPASIPRSVLLATLIQMALGIGAVISWRVTGVLAIVVDFFHYEGALFFVLVSAVELWLSYYCWRQFSTGESLGTAWRWIVGASFAHFTGMVLSQILGIESYLNPLVYAHVSHSPTLLESIRQIGLILGGPIQMALLARGLWLLLRVYRQSGLFSKLTRSDWFMIAVLTAYTVREAWQVVFLLKAGKTFTVPEAILWTSNSLLIMLLIEAIRISCGGDCSHGSGRHRYGRHGMATCSGHGVRWVGTYGSWLAERMHSARRTRFKPSGA